MILFYELGGGAYLHHVESPGALKSKHSHNWLLTAQGRRWYPPNRKLLRRRHQSSQKKRRTSQKCGTKLLRRRHQSSQKFRKYSGRQFLGPPAKLLRTPRKLLRTLDTNFSEVTRCAIRISSAASGANQNLESPRLVSLIDIRFCCVGLP